MADKFLQNDYASCPDDNNVKVVYLQAHGLSYAGFGDRHVLIWWWNSSSTPATQILQLTGQAGNYKHYNLVVKRRNPQTMLGHLQIQLGSFSRAQRDSILELARNVKFEKTSVTNGCRVWMRDLLEAMLTKGLVTQQIFDQVDAQVPLLKRQPEAATATTV